MKHWLEYVSFSCICVNIHSLPENSFFLLKIRKLFFFTSFHSSFFYYLWIYLFMNDIPVSIFLYPGFCKNQKNQKERVHEKSNYHCLFTKTLIESKVPLVSCHFSEGNSSKDGQFPENIFSWWTAFVKQPETTQNDHFLDKLKGMHALRGRR